MTDPKLCRDCRWAVNLAHTDPAPAMYYQCHHPSSAVTLPPDLVTGQPAKAEWEFCGHARTLAHNAAGEPLCGPDGQFWEPVGFGPPAATPEERRQNLAASIIDDRPITEDDEGAWEWCSLWPDSTGLPFKVWLCDIAPVVILGAAFPPRAQINDLYRWMRLNNEILETLGLYSTMEMLKRLRKL